MHKIISICYLLINFCYLSHINIFKIIIIINNNLLNYFIFKINKIMKFEILFIDNLLWAFTKFIKNS